MDTIFIVKRMQEECRARDGRLCVCVCVLLTSKRYLIEFQKSDGVGYDKERFIRSDSSRSYELV